LNTSERTLSHEIATFTSLRTTAGFNRLLNDELGELVGGLSVELVWFLYGVSEQGVGNLTASTPLSEQAIGDALGSSYRLRSGMK
jgi:hypothetical protein